MFYLVLFRQALKIFLMSQFPGCCWAYSKSSLSVYLSVWAGKGVEQEKKRLECHATFLLYTLISEVSLLDPLPHSSLKYYTQYEFTSSQLSCMVCV